MTDLKKIRSFFVMIFLMAIVACGGGGGGSEGGTESQLTTTQNGNNTPQSPQAPLVICPGNLELIDDTCQCASHLIEKDGFCFDWAETVLVGAEYLEPGFPVFVNTYSGHCYGPMYTKVGNIDKDPELEIVYMPCTGFISAINSDGSLLDGWPVWASSGYHGKILLAQFDDDPELETFSGHEGTGIVGQQGEMNIFDYNGVIKLGWPVGPVSSIEDAPAAADLDNDGYDEVVYFDGQLSLRVVDRNGVTQTMPVPIPIHFFGWNGISIADIDEDGSKDIVMISESYPDTSVIPSKMVKRILALDSNFNVMDGFPVHVGGSRSHHPVIGDVDGDGDKEIVIAEFQSNIGDVRYSIKILSHKGVTEKEINFDVALGSSFYINLVLADLNRDAVPEILVASLEAGKIYALDKDGNHLPNWPVDGGFYFSVGDVTGDGKPELVTFKDYDDMSNSGGMKNVLTIYHADGSLSDLTATIDDMSRGPGDVMPTIADIDLDGRNEVIVVGDYLGRVWAFDFGGDSHGYPEWGQIYGNARNTGEYINRN